MTTAQLHRLMCVTEDALRALKDREPEEANRLKIRFVRIKNDLYGKSIG